MLSSEDFFNTLMPDKDSKKPILCHTSLYVVEHAQLQVKVQADSMTGKEMYKWQVWQCTLWIPYHKEPHQGILTPPYPKHGSLPLTAGL